MSNPQEPVNDLPGWYVAPHMYRSLCFWDGEQWTDKVAPIPSREPLGFWGMLRAVGLGVAAGLVLVQLLSVWVAS